MTRGGSLTDGTGTVREERKPKRMEPDPLVRLSVGTVENLVHSPPSIFLTYFFRKLSRNRSRCTVEHFGLK